MTLESLAAYLKLIESDIGYLRDKVGKHAPLYDPTIRQHFLSTIEYLEKSKEFHALAQAVAVEFGDKDSEKKIAVFWEHEITAFFRLSGVYKDAFQKEALALEEIRTLFRKTFLTSTAKYTTLAPIEFVEFVIDPMVFEGFSVRRFNKDELDNIFQQNICRLFYPCAEVDTGLLSSYWFIVCSEERAIPQWGRFAWDNEVKPQYSPFSGRVKDAFRTLALYRWRDQFWDDTNVLVSRVNRQQHTSAIYPSVPFLLQVSDSLRESPLPTPDLSQLAQEPIFDNEGEEVGETRVIVFDLGAYEPKDFYQFGKEIEALLNRVVKQQEWRFIDTALNFIEKGFIEKGLDQLLWHITAVEALLGEKVESGLTNLLKNRVGRILGFTEADRKNVKKSFENLYSLRSDYVHGNVKLAEREILHGHLAQAREFARAIAVWMLFYLKHVLTVQVQGLNRLPLRENLLTILELDEDDRNQAARVLSSLPQGFPNVPGWRYE
jgi:hypothetical protein